MNIYSYIILIALLLQFLLDNIADALNLKALRHEIPPALAEINAIRLEHKRLVASQAALSALTTAAFYCREHYTPCSPLADLLDGVNELLPCGGR